MSDEPLKATPVDQAPDWKAERNARLKAVSAQYRADVAAGLKPPPRRKSIAPSTGAPPAPVETPAPPPTETPAPPPKPKGKPGPKGGDSRRSWGMRSLAEVRSYRAVLASHPAERVAQWALLPNANPDVKNQPGFGTGLWCVFPRIVAVSTRVTPHLSIVLPLIEGLRAEWPAALAPWAVDKLGELPDVVTVWRVATALNRVGLCWCLDRDHALSYARCPAIRQRGPQLVEAIVDRSNIAHLAESIHGWEVLAIVAPGDITAETKL